MVLTDAWVNSPNHPTTPGSANGTKPAASAHSVERVDLCQKGKCRQWLNNQAKLDSQEALRGTKFQVAYYNAENHNFIAQAQLS